MSVTHGLTHTTTTESGPEPANVVERLRTSVRARLRAAGVLLPDQLLDRLAEDVLADALHVALDWLESGPSPAK